MSVEWLKAIQQSFGCGDVRGFMDKEEICVCCVATTALAEIDKLRAENARLREALRDVMGWVDNWDPNFTHDDAWPESRDRARAAMADGAPCLNCGKPRPTGARGNWCSLECEEGGACEDSGDDNG